MKTVTRFELLKNVKKHLINDFESEVNFLTQGKYIKNAIKSVTILIKKEMYGENYKGA